MRKFLLAGALLALLGAPAWANWFDNFDSYSLGSINGQGGWRGWAGVPAAAGEVTNVRSFSSPQSQLITTGDDSVQMYSGYTTGIWTMNAMQYIEQPLVGGKHYFIMLNKYVEPSTFDWSIQTEFDPATNMAKDIYTNRTTPIVYNQWVPIKVVINLDADQREFFYNNVSLGTWQWKTGTGSLQNIGAVDLYSEHTSNVYYDDMSLVPEPAALALLGLVLCWRRR
ncbi:MAG: hypothetical protein AB1716_13625 [Planctomycetota bacterium]